MLQQPTDGIAGLRADAKPIQGAVFGDDLGHWASARVVMTDIFQIAAIAGFALVGHDDAVSGLSLQALTA